MKKSLFEFTDYKIFILEWIRSHPKSRGMLSRMAEAARIHKTTLSQILRGSRHFSLEQAELVCRFFDFSEKDSDYFILLVNYERAGTAALKEIFIRQIEALQQSHEQLSNRVIRSRELTSEEKAIFYSNWLYAAARNLSAIPGNSQPAQLAARLKVSMKVLEPILRFLLETGLCVKTNAGIRPGPQLTHLEASSPLVSRHHGNWRIKAMERHPMLSTEELAYSSPVTLSSQDVRRVRSLLADLVQNTNRIVQPSPSERLFCLNLDWFEIL